VLINGLKVHQHPEYNKCYGTIVGSKADGRFWVKIQDDLHVPNICTLLDQKKVELQPSYLTKVVADECAVCCARGELRRCARCKTTHYCSVEHQRLHFAEHEAACKAECLNRERANGESCLICLQSTPAPIQSGCGCRGDAGLAHVSCRVRLVEYSGDPTEWWVCRTCSQNFTGQMLDALAVERWRGVQGLPESDEKRLSAANMLARSLLAQEKYAEAQQLLQEVLVILRCVHGEQHGGTLATADNLALTLSYQGKHADAETLGRELHLLKSELLGEHHPSTLTTASNVALSLSRQGKHAEAILMQQELLVSMKRVYGSDHRNTLTAGSNLAASLWRQGMCAEAEVIERGVLATRRLVFGAEHPDTLYTADNLAQSLLDQGKFAEADTILREVLATKLRVLGPEHANTQLTAGSLLWSTQRQLDDGLLMRGLGGASGSN
jgi:tetratricopeptide (TPR) repeat protein